jgi:hypothetical protein
LLGQNMANHKSLPIPILNLFQGSSISFIRTVSSSLSLESGSNKPNRFRQSTRVESLLTVFVRVGLY